jgi:hypothetical protein
MREIVEFELADIKPDRNSILKGQGIPTGADINKRILALADQSLTVFMELCLPIGIMAEVSTDEFEFIYEGEGLNESLTPVAEIFPKADNLSLFALTLGSEISDEINDLFEEGEFALAALLDSAASEGTENAGKNMVKKYHEFLRDNSRMRTEWAVVPYSPGYCGWHISGQRRLFEFLKPEEIGITLRESYMMDPLKSISGLMIAGKREIHKFNMTYPFCSACASLGCRERIKALTER